MRPTTRTTRATRLVDAEDTDVAVPRPSEGSSRSSRTGTPVSDRGKKPRHRMTDKQLERLEALYQEDTHPTREQKQALGEDVGMDTRTVTVWFQNRRQLAKKQSLIVNSTQPMCRQPLLAVPQRTNQLSRQSSVSSFCQSSSSDRASPRPYIGSRKVKRELWEHLPSTPPSLPDSAVTSVMPSPVPKKTRSFSEAYPEAGQENVDVSGKPILEWACARMTKRQRLQPAEDEDLYDGETEDEDTLVDIEANPTSDNTGKANTCVASPRNFEAVAIPPEYKGQFDDDILFGASLLLTFTYAYRS